MDPVIFVKLQEKYSKVAMLGDDQIDCPFICAVTVNVYTPPSASELEAANDMVLPESVIRDGLGPATAKLYVTGQGLDFFHPSVW